MSKLFVGVTRRIRINHKNLTLGVIPADCVGREIWTSSDD